VRTRYQRNYALLTGKGIIYSNNKLEHKTYMKKVLDCFYNISLQVNIKKCEFEVKHIKYLKFIISTSSIKVDLEKVKVI